MKILCTFLLVFAPSLLLANESKIYVGTQKIVSSYGDVEVSIRVFYPTMLEAKATRFGPWLLDIAKNKEPINGLYPLVIISHGLGGNDWNHHLLAGELVKAGFMVAAVRHPDDFLRVGTPEHYVLRPLELQFALNTLLEHEKFGGLINRYKIGAFGFSLGGYTVLAAAGGKISLDRISKHCSIAKNDPEFCIGEDGEEMLHFWLQAKRKFYTPPEIDIRQDVLDIRIKAVVAAAPVGLPFYDFSRNKAPIMLIRAGADKVLRYPYHSENIHEFINREHVYKVIDGLHHYSFLSPFPESIASEVGEPAEDPSEFDRLAFLKEINAEIASFFVAHLD